MALSACGGSAEAELADAGSPGDAGARTLCDEGDLLAAELGTFTADFESNGVYHVYGIDLHGDAPACLLRLTNDLLLSSQDGRDLQWSPNGRWLVFRDDATLKIVEFGQEAFPLAQQLTPKTHRGGVLFQISPDSEWVGWKGRDGGEVEEQAYLSALGAALPAPPIRLNEITGPESTAAVAGWNPDGSSLLLYQRSVDGGRWTLLWVGFEDGEPRDPISLGTRPLGNVSQFAWSPAGDQVMFVAVEALNVSSLYVVDVSGASPSAPRRISEASPEGQAVFEPVWSPDGEWILYRFRAGTGTETGSGLVLADPRGNLTPQAVSAHDNIRRHGWVDATTLYLSFRESPQTEPLQFVEIEGDVVGQPAVVSESAGTLAFSPNRRYLAFPAVQDLETSPSVGLFVLDIASPGEGPIALLPDLPANAEAGLPSERSWSGDSTMFAFLVQDGPEREIYVARVTDSGTWSTTPVAEGLDVRALIGFSPHSHKLIFRATEDDENPSLYLVDPDAAPPGAVPLHQELRLTAQAGDFQWRPAATP